MKVVMPAAGRGTRLFGEVHEQPPKVLLEFDGRSLLARHLAHFRALGLDGLHLVTGFRVEAIEEELAALGADDFVQTYFNPDYEVGSIVSLAAAIPALSAGDDVLFLDADMLYHPALLERAIAAPAMAAGRARGAVTLDRALEPGEDPVMVCLEADGRIGEFGKERAGSWHRTGEWPGVLRLAADAAAELGERAEAAVAAGRRHDTAEDAIRELLLASPEHFEVVDVSDVPWIEIDFPEDVERARHEILPRVQDVLSHGDLR